MGIVYLITERPGIGGACPSLRRLSPDALKGEPPMDAAAFVIDMTAPDRGEEILRRVRGHAAPAVYLRPVIMAGIDAERPLARAADAVVSIAATTTGDTLPGLLDRLDTINSRIELLPDIEMAADTNFSLKVIRYLYSREGALEPVRGIRGRQGFSYPAIEAMLPTGDDSVFGALDFLEGQNLLFSDFVARIHQCNRCQSAFLNFQEVCPDCGSSNLEVDDLLHHYPCANVGPAADFRTGGRLVCPKCDKGLRQIGVDYDKPSSVYRCRACGRSFQDAVVQSECFNCGRLADPEELLVRTLKKYELSALGAHAALYGLDSLFRNVLERDVNSIPYDSFKLIVQAEVERIKRYKISTSAVLMCELAGLDEVYYRLGAGAAEVFAEIGAAIKSILRKSDIVSPFNDSIFIALLVETPEEGVRTAISRLRGQLDTLMERNLEQAVTLEAGFRIITGSEDAETILGDLTRHDVSA